MKRQASPGTHPWSRILDETRSRSSVQWRTYSLECGHFIAVRRKGNAVRSRFFKCKECPPVPMREHRAKMTRIEICRLGAAARNAKMPREERSRIGRLGAAVSGRRMASVRAERAARIHAVAVEGATLIRDAVARGGRVDFRDFADERNMPYERLRRTFRDVHGVGWTEAHRRAR